MKEGGEGVERRKLSSPPLPSLLLAPFFAQSLTLVPRSLLLNPTETLATQANLGESIFFFAVTFSMAASRTKVPCDLSTMRFFLENY